MGNHYGAGMRHVGTLIAASIIAPLAWVLIAFGQDRSAAAFLNAQSNGSTLHGSDFVRPLQFLVAAGLVLGLIAILRFSPLGALVSGLGYVSSYALLGLATPIRTGSALLVGALLLVGTASVGRWRRWPRPAGETFETPMDRAVGADGLGLLPPDRSTEPELAARYSTRYEPVGGGGSRTGWGPTGPGGGLKEAPW